MRPAGLRPVGLFKGPGAVDTVPYRDTIEKKYTGIRHVPHHPCTSGHRNRADAPSNRAATCWSDSKTVREGIKILNGLLPRGGRRKIFGQGQFDSGIADLGSNKDHLKGYGT